MRLDRGGTDRVGHGLGLGGANPHARAGRIRELVQRRVGHEPAAGDDDHVVDRLGDLGQDVAGEQDRAPLRSEGAQEVAQPADAFGVEPVRGLVEDEDPRVADQRARETESLAHAEREPAGTPVGCTVELDEP